MVDQQGEDARANSLHVAQRIQAGQIVADHACIRRLVGAALIGMALCRPQHRPQARPAQQRHAPHRRRRFECRSFMTVATMRLPRWRVPCSFSAKQQRMRPPPAKKEIEQVRTSDAPPTISQGWDAEVSKARCPMSYKPSIAPSKAMDSSARDMADNASRHQEQAIATAAASERGDPNVETVAAAAEEIAQSIEHIAARVANRLRVARQASDEAQAITERG